jgi:hypothetical protein
MITASDLIEKLGGHKAVADRLGITRNGIQRWTYPKGKEKGGLGNRVPMKHWAALMAMAADVGQPITLNELMPPDMAAVVSRPQARRQADNARRRGKSC